MKIQDDSNEQCGLGGLFDQTAEAPSGPELTRLAARAEDIPTRVDNGFARKWWLPLSVSAVAAAAALGFWLVEFRREGRGVDVAVAARAVPPHLTADRVDSVQGAPALTGSSALPSALAEEGFEEEEPASDVSLEASDAEPGVLAMSEFFEDTDGLRAFNAEDLFGPALDSDVDVWMLATNDLPGEKR